MVTGGCEWVSEEVVFPLMPQFAGVPALAWQCTLTDIYPLEGCKAEYPGGWDRQSVDAFSNMIEEEENKFDMYITNPRSCMVNEMLQVKHY